jgi:hypothetical protein
MALVPYFLAFSLTVLPPLLLYYSSIYLQFLGLLIYLALITVAVYFYRKVPTKDEMRILCTYWIAHPLPPPSPLTPLGVAFTRMVIKQIPRIPLDITDIRKVSSTGESNGKKRTKIRRRGDGDMVITNYTIRTYSYIMFLISSVEKRIERTL